MAIVSKQMTVNGKIRQRNDQPEKNKRWSWEKLSSGEELRVHHQYGRKIEIVIRRKEIDVN